MGKRIWSQKVKTPRMMAAMMHSMMRMTFQEARSTNFSQRKI